MKAITLLFLFQVLQERCLGVPTQAREMVHHVRSLEFAYPLVDPGKTEKQRRQVAANSTATPTPSGTATNDTASSDQVIVSTPLVTASTDGTTPTSTESPAELNVDPASTESTPTPAEPVAEPTSESTPTEAIAETTPIEPVPESSASEPVVEPPAAEPTVQPTSAAPAVESTSAELTPVEPTVGPTPSSTEPNTELAAELSTELTSAESTPTESAAETTPVEPATTPISVDETSAGSTPVDTNSAEVTPSESTAEPVDGSRSAESSPIAPSAESTDVVVLSSALTTPESIATRSTALEQLSVERSSSESVAEPTVEPTSAEPPGAEITPVEPSSVEPTSEPISADSTMEPSSTEPSVELSAEISFADPNPTETTPVEPSTEPTVQSSSTELTLGPTSAETSPVESSSVEPTAEPTAEPTSVETTLEPSSARPTSEPIPAETTPESSSSVEPTAGPMESTSSETIPGESTSSKPASAESTPTSTASLQIPLSNFVAPGNEDLIASEPGLVTRLLNDAAQHLSPNDPDVRGWQGYGCFISSDFFNDTLVSPNATSSSASMSPQDCISLCAPEGADYSFVSGDSCYCSSTPPPPSAGSTQCQTPCSADTTLTCGNPAIGGYSVFRRILATGTTVPLPARPTSNSFSYGGCFIASSFIATAGLVIPDSSGIDACATAAVQGGYTYLGLQGDTCYASDTPPDADLEAGIGLCASACPGNPLQACGGAISQSMIAKRQTTGDGTDPLITLYAATPDLITEAPTPDTTATGPTGPGNFFVDGCFSAESSVLDAYLNGQVFVNDGNTSAANSGLLCVSQCLTAGFDYAFTQSTSCYCSNDALTTPAADQTDCNQACPGSNVERCGGQGAYNSTNGGIFVTVYSKAALNPDDQVRSLVSFFPC